MASEFYGWFDDHKTSPIAERIERGRMAYIGRFHTSPVVVLVSEKDAEGLASDKIRILVKSYMRPNNYYYGMSDPG